MIYGKRGHKPVSSACKNHKKTVILACELYQLCLNTLPVTVHPHPLPSVRQQRRATHKGHQVGTKKTGLTCTSGQARPDHQALPKSIWYL